MFLANTGLDSVIDGTDVELPFCLSGSEVTCVAEDAAVDTPDDVVQVSLELLFQLALLSLRFARMVGYSFMSVLVTSMRELATLGIGLICD